MIAKNTIHLIFDFDGTLVDSFGTVVEKFNLIADEYAFKKIDNQEINHLKEFMSKELIKYLKIPLYKIPSVINKARAVMRDEMHLLSPFTFVPEMLQELVKAKITLGILTSNSLENVTEWLKCHNLQHFFDFIQVDSSYFGKKNKLMSILKSYQLDKTNTFYAGDETRDIEAAKASGVRSIAVTWGFNSERILAQFEPDYIARQPADILDIFKRDDQL